MIENSIKEILFSTLGISESNICGEISQDNIPEWDSLKQINLVIAIEEYFNVRIEPDEIEEMDNLNSIIEVLQRKLK